MEPRLSYVVDKVSGCWLWQKSTHNGYGQQWAGGHNCCAHRLMWERVNGPIPPRHDLHHTCGTRRCINPGHLRLLPNEEHDRLHMLGNRRARRKVRESDVRLLRDLRRDGAPQSALAGLFGITVSAVSMICSRKRWRQVA